MTDKKPNHPKGWKRKYHFSRQGDVAMEREKRVAYLTSREHRQAMFEIRMWNRMKHPEYDDHISEDEYRRLVPVEQIRVLYPSGDV